MILDFIQDFECRVGFVQQLAGFDDSLSVWHALLALHDPLQFAMQIARCRRRRQYRRTGIVPPHADDRIIGALRIQQKTGIPVIRRQMFRRRETHDVPFRFVRQWHIIADELQLGGVGVFQEDKHLALRHDNLADAGLRHLRNGLRDRNHHTAEFSECGI